MEGKGRAGFHDVSFITCFLSGCYPSRYLYLPLFTLQMTCFKGVSLFAFLFVADRGLEEVNFDSNVCQETLYPCRERS